ncbi:MAG TPA: nuclear transport factor 2 family protein [Jatrophihabitantaceae bacterium]
MPSDEDQVIAAARARGRALVARDVADLRSLLHPAFGWVSHHGEVFDRDRYITANTARGGTHWIDQQLAYPHVTIVGSTAILRCTVTDVIRAVDREQRLRMLMTQTWIRDTGRWRCVAGHAGPRLD